MNAGPGGVRSARGWVLSRMAARPGGAHAGCGRSRGCGTRCPCSEIVLRRAGPGVELCVRDDGHGTGDAAEGAGIRGMRERALLVGAGLVLGPGPGGGTEVRLTVPVPTPVPDPDRNGRS